VGRTFHCANWQLAIGHGKFSTSSPTRAPFRCALPKPGRGRPVSTSRRSLDWGKRIRVERTGARHEFITGRL
jgi:hypothetical protein